MSMAFRDDVRAEAKKQKELLSAGKAIPAEYKKFARKSGLGIFLVGGVGALAIVGVGTASGTYYVAFILLFAVLSGAGLLQVITGKHIISGKK